MAYTYSAFVFVTDSDGRSTNFSDIPTITAVDGGTASVIVAPVPTITNITVGLYKLELVAYGTLTDVLWKIVPPAADLENLQDLACLQGKVEQTVDENLDVKSSTLSTLTQADILSDATPFPGAFIDAAISTAVCDGPGAAPYEITVTDGGGVPLDGANVWVTTDLAGANIIFNGFTDTFGKVSVMLDAGTYYAWKQLAGYTFTNPESFVAP
jgi:hypothetical protein